MQKLINQQLNQLARDLQRADLWDDNSPTPEKLASCEPFCVDTLTFEQWLQWVFIPKLRDMLTTPNFTGLPNKSDIHSMAEYTFNSYAQNTDRICQTIKAIDDALNQ